MTTTTYGGTVLDFDGDGPDDVFISRHLERGRLFRGRGGRFVPAPSDPLPARDRHGCAAADVDGDGRDELHCAIGAARGVRFKTDEQWTDLGREHPRSVAGIRGLDDPIGRGRRALFAHLDGDDRPDLLTTSDPLRVDGLPSVNHAYLSGPGGGFAPAPELGLDLPVGGACLAAGDLDGDRRDEVVVCTDEPWGGPAGARLFGRGAGARFRDVTHRLGVQPAADRDVAITDLDGDGRSDLVLVSPYRLAVHLQRDGRQQRVLTWSLRAGTAVAAGDADGDGTNDLYVVQGGIGGNADDLLLLNRGTGRAFRSVRIPQARAGTADDVLAIDHDRDGLMGFLVLNGALRSGPVQLIEARRT
jgi:hypothetical protein